MVGNRIRGLVYSYVGVIAAEDALVLDLIGPIHPKALDEGASDLLEALEGPDAVVGGDGVVGEVDVGLGADLVAEQDVVGIL